MSRSRINNGRLGLLLLLLLLAPGLSEAAVTKLDDMPSNVGTSSISNPHSFNFTVTAGATLLVCATTVTTPFPVTLALGATGTPTYNTVPMTLGFEETITDTGSGLLAVRVTLWTLLSPATGSNSFSVAPGTNYGQTIAGCMTFSGTHLSAPLGTHQVAFSTTSVASSALPAFTTTAGSAVVDLIATGGGGNTSGTTLTWNNDGVAGSYYARWSTSSFSTASNPTMSYTFTNDAYLMVGIEILAPAAGGATCKGSLLLLGVGGC